MELIGRDIWETALRQSAIDAGCRPEDFLLTENAVVLSRKHPAARKYLELPLACHLISYGNNVVASVGEPYRDLVAAYIDRFPAYRCFETPQLHLLDDALRERGLRVCFMAEYFLPEPGAPGVADTPCELRLMGPEDFAPLYTDQWGNALCEKRKELDVLGVGAYAGAELAGLAACSADCEDMWQIGVDVRPPYRRQGIAAAATARLAREILARGKVPFYCAAWSNLPSVRNALRSGFRPAWVELTAKPETFVRELNGER